MGSISTGSSILEGSLAKLFRSLSLRRSMWPTQVGEAPWAPAVGATETHGWLGAGSLNRPLSVSHSVKRSGQRAAALGLALWR